MDNDSHERRHDPNYDKTSASIDKHLYGLSELVKIQVGTLGMNLRERTGYRFDIVLALNILRNEDRAKELDTEKLLHKPEDRQLLLRDAATLLIHDNQVLPGIDDLVPGYLERYNHIEEQLSRINETEPIPLTHEMLKLHLAKLRAELHKEDSETAKDEKHNPFIKWVRNRRWPLRP